MQHYPPASHSLRLPGYAVVDLAGLDWSCVGGDPAWSDARILKLPGYTRVDLAGLVWPRVVGDPA